MEILQTSLGKFYFLAHDNAPPTFLQVIGWTRGAERENVHKLYVYVRKVPLKIYNYMGNGNWEYDYNIIKEFKNEIVSPIHNSNNKLVDGNAIIIPNGNILRYQSLTIPLKNF
jgi:5-formaminoimidazole-4-carboxamide-1-beta-D-ribofuranosyl 5'-monophosphate synthetase